MGSASFTSTDTAATCEFANYPALGQGLYPFLREEAAAWLADHPADHPRYVKRRRLTGLDLPGGSAVQAGRCRRSPVVRKVVRTPRAVGK